MAASAPPLRVVDGERMRDDLLDQVRAAVSSAPRPPGLAIVYDGSSAASRRWTEYKQDACSRAAVRLVARELDAGARTDTAAVVVRELDLDPDVSAIFLQNPPPGAVDPTALAGLVRPAKDVDGLHWVAGELTNLPASARAALWVLESCDVRLRDTRVVILGEPGPILDALVALLTSRGSSVRAVSPTDPTARGVCSQAGVLVTAAGRPGLVDDEWLSRGAVVIDAGVLVGGGAAGDVHPHLNSPALLCPARGGLGPVTVAALVWRTVELTGIPLSRRTRAR
jgi:methylenetetrahydrofolate dehydrogenase (NADP+)/methenyltetrahydrofolate cyclohydrolase